MHSEYRQRFISSLNKVAAKPQRRDKGGTEEDSQRFPTDYAGAVRRLFAPPADPKRTPGTLAADIAELSRQSGQDMAEPILQAIQKNGIPIEVLHGLTTLPKETRQPVLKGLASGNMTPELQKQLVEGGKRAKHLATEGEKFKGVMSPKSEGVGPLGAMGIMAGGVVGANLVNTLVGKASDWWDDRQKHNKFEESFERIIASHPKFKNVSGDDAIKLRSLHNVIADYSPKLLDHPSILGDVMYQAAQYDQFDPSMLKTLTEPERNLGSIKKDKFDISENPGFRALKNVAEASGSVQSMVNK